MRKQKSLSGKRKKSGGAGVSSTAPDIETAGTITQATEGATVGDCVVDTDFVARSVSSFPVVGIGASAGGLEAFTQLLAQLPADSGMAFILIQHLDPAHKSFLGEALAKATQMPVKQIQEGELVESNHVYVMPSDADISIRGDRLMLVSREGDASKSGLHLPIDSFFSVLARERGSNAIGVVLSGTASDGTEGLRAIRAAGGITLAQAPATARFDGMPKSAIAAGVVDCVLPISGLAEELVRFGRHPYLVAHLDSGQPHGLARGEPINRMRDAMVLAKIRETIRTAVGVDFGEYKSPTFERRLARRMALRRIESREIYLELLEGDAEEVRGLYEDTLIHISSFFRDPEVFEFLKASVWPEIVRQKVEGGPIRVWVAGCSTGEEVYSHAMLLVELLGDSAFPHPVQIFGTDVSEQSIQSARAGKYFEGAMRGINDDRRRRYFTKIDSGYRINKTVRDLCVFVRHDLARDPPFSRLDLVSCRNVLIYFDQPLQKRIVPTFHYSLNQPGFLLLGRTEHVSGFAQLFSPVDASLKIFARSGVPSSLRFSPRSERHPAQNQPIAADAGGFAPRAGDLGRHLDNLLLARYAPPGVLVNDSLEVLQFRGQTGSYLQPAPGEPQNNLVKMARGGLLSKLRSTVARAKMEMAPVRTDGVEVDQNGFTRTCDVVVLPFSGLPDVKEQLFVVLFEERAGSVAPLESVAVADTGRIPKLEYELSATTEYLHSLIEEHSRTNDDLGSANEELVSGNEELQSLNEELETAKEELQSTNEELITVNDELNVRNQEVSLINSDLINLLNTVEVPILILDRNRKIRRFTPGARNILNVLPSDLGRQLDDIRLNIEAPDLDRQIAEVIATAAVRESDVQDQGGRWHRMQIRPYRTTEGEVDGAIVSLFDIDSLKHHINEVQHAKEEAERADQAKDQFLAVLSHELRTPLSALLMQTQLLRQAGADGAKRERACDAIERSTRMQVQLIDDLLDVSRIVTGKLKVVLEPVNLVAVVKVTLDSVGALAEAKGIEVRTSLDPSLGPVSGDRTRLEQVVSNLLTNAIKFTPRGGRIEIVLEKSGGVAHLRVSDTGMGIDAHFLPRVFNRLTQKDSSSTRPHGGLGLGLAIVRHLVDAHGGSVRAESLGTGHGATFHVRLPLLAERSGALHDSTSDGVPSDTAPQRGSMSSTRFSGRRILLVEDDPSTRDALAEMFTGVGATVKTADSALQGINCLEEFQPDVLISDIAMPGEDGYSLIRKVRALSAERGGNIPALALTALAGEANRRRALSQGFQVHLVKPVDMDRLADAVEDLLESG